jgi:hypothetical protein
MRNREPFTVQEFEELLRRMERLAAAGAALPASRLARLLHRTAHTIRRLARAGVLERLPDGSITTRSVLKLLKKGYFSTPDFDLLDADDSREKGGRGG